MRTLILLSMLLVPTRHDATQTPPAPASSAAAQAAPPSSVVPVARTDEGILARQTECLRRAKESAPAPVVFVGDSITQGWESAGAAVWKERMAPLGALDLGVSGDRTEHVLWRLKEAPLTRLEPRAIVLLIGTNNLGRGANMAEETLLGVTRVIAMLREQCPKSRILALNIFPRGERFNAMRGEIAQINQALSRLDDGEHVRCLRIGDRFVEADGSIRREIMPDFLHLSEAGYRIWADGLVPELENALKSKR
jgi:lysophospholipase L1-like esterase